MKDTTDPAWANDQGVKDYIALINEYVPESDRVSDRTPAGGYTAAQAMEDVLRRAGDDLTRANIMKIASAYRSLDLPALSAGHHPQHLARQPLPDARHPNERYNGTRWEMIGKPISE